MLLERFVSTRTPDSPIKTTAMRITYLCIQNVPVDAAAARLVKFVEFVELPPTSASATRAAAAAISGVITSSGAVAESVSWIVPFEDRPRRLICVSGLRLYLLRRGFATRALLSLSDAAIACSTRLRAAARSLGVARLMSGLLSSKGIIRGRTCGCTGTSIVLRDWTSVAFLGVATSPKFQLGGSPMPEMPVRGSDAIFGPIKVGSSPLI